MIRTVNIENLRGIRSGTLDGLNPLTLLVGPNGSGKSAVLDALLIGASPNPGAAVARAVGRHQMAFRGARWLLWKTGSAGDATIAVSNDVGPPVVTELRDGSKPHQGESIRVSSGGGPPLITVRFDEDNQATPLESPFTNVRAGAAPDVRIIESWTSKAQPPLHQIYSLSAQQGTRSQAVEIITSLLPEIENLEIQTEGDTPYLAAVYANRSVPVALAGDGVNALVRLAFELAVSPAGLVLVEEPEIHQHPAAISQTAKAVLAAVRRTVQVVISTHSLELIDALLMHATDDDRLAMALFRLHLLDGELRSSRLDGADMALSRTQVEDDLR
jgi:predicted ATPase